MSADLKILHGHVYEARKPRLVGSVFHPLVNDRQVVWTNGERVQFDSPSVRIGKGYPIVSREEFLKWAGRDITDQMADGEWRNALPGKEKAHAA